MPWMTGPRPNLHRHCDNHNTSHDQARGFSAGVTVLHHIRNRTGLASGNGAGPAWECQRVSWKQTASRPLALWYCPDHILSMPMPVNQSGYSVVVKLRAPPPNSWRWEIYRAGRSTPIEQASVCFDTVAAASRAGKEALTKLLDELQSKQLRWPAA
jgi:hypothetical protein